MAAFLPRCRPLKGQLQDMATQKGLQHSFAVPMHALQRWAMPCPWEMSMQCKCAKYAKCEDQPKADGLQATSVGTWEERPRTVLGIVLVVRAVPKLPVLRAASTQQAPLLSKPHGELCAAGHRRAALHQRLCRRQQQLCACMQAARFTL